MVDPTEETNKPPETERSTDSGRQEPGRSQGGRISLIIITIIVVILVLLYLASCRR
jgi:hypothetical protein